MKKVVLILLLSVILISSFSCGPRRYKCGPYRRCETKEKSTKPVNFNEINKIRLS